MPRKTKEQRELENEKITSTKQNKEAKSNSKISANKKDLEPKKQKATSKSNGTKTRENNQAFGDSGEFPP